MSVNCPKCNTNNPDTAKFCGECGTQLPSPKDLEVTMDNDKIKLTKEALVSLKNLPLDLFRYNAEKKICEIKIPLKTGKQVITIKFE
jgi:hypothetical protein